MPKRISEEEKSEPFRFSVVEENDEGSVIEISVEDYERDIAAGIPADELLKPGKHLLRRLPDRLRPKPEDLLPMNVNVICELRLKLDIFNCLKRLAGSEKMEDVEGVLNERLRAALEEELKDAESFDIRNAA